MKMLKGFLVFAPVWVVGGLLNEHVFMFDKYYINMVYGLFVGVVAVILAELFITYTERKRVGF